MSDDATTVLRDLIEHLEDVSDVDDGPDGEPRPNWAMDLLQEYGDRARAAIRAGTKTTDRDNG